MKRSAVGAVAAQGAQALASFVLQVAVAKVLGISALGAFAILYGVVVLASATVTGFVGDSLVVLDRRSRPIRSALEQYALAFAVGGGVLAGVVTTALGFTSVLEGALLALATAADANAQCRPSRGSNEAKLLAFYSAPILFGTVSAPETANAWGVRVSAEVVPIPTVDDALTEHLNANIDAAVKAGKLTEERAAKAKEHVDRAVDRILDADGSGAGRQTLRDRIKERRGN